MTQEKKQEFTLKITQANKTQLVTIMYEMIIEYMEEAIDLITVGKKSEVDKPLRHAQLCIDGLIRSLDHEYELARMLYRIYLFSKKELTAAGASYNIHRIWRVEQNFKRLHSAFKEIENQDESAPMMANTESVYAGLTYGRYDLNESVGAASFNRGFMA